MNVQMRQSNGIERDDLSISEVVSMTFKVCLHRGGEGAAET